MSAIEGEPVTDGRLYDIIEIRNIRSDYLEASRTDSDLLTKLLDADRLDGSYKLEIHGPIIAIENSSASLSRILVNEPELFVDWIGLERSVECNR